MKSPERATLMSAFERMLDVEDDPLSKLLVMTYEFDDQQMLNMLVQRPLSDRLDATPAHAAHIADLAPVVIYDARKTRPDSTLPHVLDVLPVRVAAWRCHHPKAYLAVTKKRVHLLIGSMNLTATGLFSNREAFASFTWDDQALADLHILESFADLLEQEYRHFDSGSLASIVATVRARVARWAGDRQAAQATKRLIANGFTVDGQGRHALDQLQAFFREHFADRQPDSLHVVSPFFDKGAGGDFLVGEFEARFGVPRAVEVVTDESALPALSRAHLGQAGRQAVFAIPAEVSAGERKLISGANDGAATGALVIDRKLHAKILVLGCGPRRLVYIGSGNFTRKAWCGDNHELGVAWIEDGEASALWRDIRRGLCCDDADRLHDLALRPAPAVASTDDDDYVCERGYPDFVTGISLTWHDAVFRFTIDTAPAQAGELARHKVDWDKLPLTFTPSQDACSATSEPLRDDLVRARLIGGRNLRFEWAQDSAVAHFLPFRHDKTLFDRRFEFVHPTADDWMAHCLGRDVDKRSADPDENLPDDPPPPPPLLQRALDDRASNAIIRTQRFLSDFDDVETEFRQRADDWAATSEPDPAAWELRIGQPLTTFARILERTVADTVDAAFRLGELKLLTRTLRGPEDGLKRLGAEVSGALARRHDPARADAPVVRGLAPYVRFVEGTSP